MQASRCIAVVGMHRSGTSTVARWLHENGVNMGNELLGADVVGNPYGHYEDLDFLNLSRQLLRINGTSTYLPSKTEFSGYHVRKAYFLQLFKNDINRFWGWKDPNYLLFKDLWNEAIPFQCKIFLIRRPEEIVGSLITRDLGALKRLRKNSFFRSVQARALEWKYKATIKSKYIYYLKSYIFYHRRLLEDYEATQVQKRMLVDAKALIQKEDAIRLFIRANDIEIGDVSFGSIVDKSMMRNRGDSKILARSSQFEEALELFEKLKAKCV